jgi:hypothetical protein
MSRNSTPETTAPEATEAVVTSTPVSAYGFAKIVNRLIADNPGPGLKELPVQMFYSYKAKGLLGTDKKPLTAEYAVEWFAAYAERKVQREQTKVEKAQAELQGDTEATQDEAE